MAPTVTVIVPPAQADAVRETLLGLYAARAAALAEATRAHVEAREPLGPVLEHRDDLAELEGLIDLAGWRPRPRPDEVELVGPPGLVREAVYESLASAADAFARAVGRYERGEIGLKALRRRAHAATALLGVFSALERAGP